MERTLPAGIGQRIFAFLIDGALLWIVGYLISSNFEDYLFGLGPEGLAIGFTISLLYFGLFNSALGSGATLGKRIMHIRVVSLDGDFLPLHRSLMRYIILAVPFYASRIGFPAAFVGSGISAALNFGLFAVFAYLFLFNRPSRRSLHDLAAQSVVVVAGVNLEACPGSTGKVHYYVSGSLLLLAFVIPAIPMFTFGESDVGPQEVIFDRLSQLDDISVTSVVLGGTIKTDSAGNSHKEAILHASAYTRGRPADVQGIIDTVALAIFETPEYLVGVEKVIVELQWGYDIGIAQATYAMEQQYGKESWTE